MRRGVFIQEIQGVKQYVAFKCHILKYRYCLLEIWHRSQELNEQPLRQVTAKSIQPEVEHNYLLDYLNFMLVY